MTEKIETIATHGRLYHLFDNIVKKKIKVWWTNHRIAFLLSCIVSLAVLFVFREEFQPIVIIIRQYFFLELIVLAFAYGSYKMIVGKKWLFRFIGIGILAVMIGSTWLCYREGIEVRDYMMLYSRYGSLNIVEPGKLPLTGHERIYPPGAIQVLAKGTSDNEVLDSPSFVRYNGQFRYTSAVEPAFFWGKLTDCIREIADVNGTAAITNFAHRVPVNFCIGENFFLGKKTDTAVIRNFGIARFFNYEPSDIRFMKNDSGEWVEVVSLIRWKGLLFPYPVFGGVQVIEQDKVDANPGEIALSVIERTFFGKGAWIAPEKIKDYPFLQGQSIVSKDVTKAVASSMKFRFGILAPIPGRHLGDVRIPEQKANAGSQPFITYFKDSVPEGLYHYFGLEPWKSDNYLLSTSVLVPADGTNIVYVFHHKDRGEQFVGSSQTSSYVYDLNKSYTTQNLVVAGNRPFIRDCSDGVRRLFWISTLGTIKDKEAGTYAMHTPPEVFIADRFAPVSVDSTQPETWIPTLEAKLTPMWNNQDK